MTSNTKIMTKSQQARLARLMPGGKPKYIRVYDNNGETADRFTVVFTGNYRGGGWGAHRGDSQHICMSGSPYHPQGVCMHGTSIQPIDVVKNRWGGVAMGRRCHLGKRIAFEDLPIDCQTVVMDDYRDLWDLPN